MIDADHLSKSDDSSVDCTSPGTTLASEGGSTSLQPLGFAPWISRDGNSRAFCVNLPEKINFSGISRQMVNSEHFKYQLWKYSSRICILFSRHE